MHPTSTLKSTAAIANTLAIVVGLAAPAWSQSRPTIIPAQPSQPSLDQLVREWGFSAVSCGGNVAQISSQDETVCVQPTAELPAGNYTYDRASNQIAPSDAAGSPPPDPAPSPIAGTLEFNFTSFGGYNDCVEDLLDLYEGRERSPGGQSPCAEEAIRVYGTNGLSRQQAREAIELADFRATNLLTLKFYPLRGLRVRVAQLLGYIYEVDSDDPQMQDFATP